MVVSVDNSQEKSISLKVDTNSTYYLYTNETFYTDLSNIVTSTIDADNMRIDTGILKSNDLAAYCYEVCNSEIKQTTNGDLEAQSPSYTEAPHNMNFSDAVDGVGEAVKHTLSINSDNFVITKSGSDSVTLPWTKINNSDWAQFISLTPLDEAQIPQARDIKITYSWNSNIANYAMLPCFILAILLYCGSILLMIISRHNSNKGTHVGDIKTFRESLKENRSGFALPNSVNVSSAKDFANQYENSSQSMIDKNIQSSYFASQIEDNNLNADANLNVSELFSGNNAVFNVQSKISDKDENYDLKAIGLTRKELRKQRLLGNAEDNVGDDSDE